MKFTAKQQMLIDEYLVDLNGTQTAIRAGDSEKTVRTTAAELLAIGNIRERIEELEKT